MGIYAHHPRKANFLRRKMAATILKYLGACPNPITVVNNLFTFYEGNPLKSINLHYPLFFQCFGMTQTYYTLYFSASIFFKGVFFHENQLDCLSLGRSWNSCWREVQAVLPKITADGRRLIAWHWTWPLGTGLPVVSLVVPGTKILSWNDPFVKVKGMANQSVPLFSL